ncbi:MFS transporter [Candidatus Solincola tengchongensis]|uniref:MFS transporter n=1 Tax=Candidatus Solincola tengchongensis TaxID=2900693 RepID=UPI00257D759B|nr:MFS transporter [Candidatus Solincola tengchongensis]
MVTSAGGSGEAGGALASFRHRDFRLLWSGAFVSNVGTWIHNTALLWFVKETTGTNTWVGAVNMASFLPLFLLVLWSGSLADRLDRRKMIIATQSAMMLGALGMGLCLRAGLSSMGAIIPLTAAMGLAFVFNFPAWRSIIPDLVPPRDMLNGIALDAAQFNLARCVGPLLGALVLNLWGAETAFYVNAASFLAVLAALLLLRTKTPPVGKAGATGSHILEVLRLAAGEGWARNQLLLLGVMSFFGLSFLVLLPGLSRDVLMRGSGGYGALLSAIGAGAAVGAPLVTLLRRRLPERAIIKASAVVVGLALLGVAVCRVFWLCVVLSVILGTSSLMMSAAINTVLQARVGREMRGRIMSLYILVFQGLYPLGGMFLGFMSDRITIPWTLVLGGSVCTAAGLTVVLFPSLLRHAVTSARDTQGA